MSKIVDGVLRKLYFVALVACLVGLGWSGFTAVRYLRTAPRFEVEKLTVSGLKRVDESQVLAKAGFQLGTNVFRADLTGIRQRVEELQWVRHAIVQRLLPDQIIIKVTEREPIGLARIRGELHQFDIDAMILDVKPGSERSFPVLDGLRFDDEAKNKVKVQTYKQVVDELGETELSEVRVGDSGDVSVVSASDPLMVDLGVVDFRNRWIKYLQLKAQIQEKYPQAVGVDLRFKNQIIVRMTDDDAGEMILWDEEKKTL